MLTVAESKSSQAQNLINNIMHDIYSPLKKLAEEHGHAITGISYEGRKAMKGAKELKEQLLDIKSEYLRSKGEMERSIHNYEKFKTENPGGDKDSEFYKDKLFKQMNAKMRVCQEKGNMYEI